MRVCAALLVAGCMHGTMRPVSPSEELPTATLAQVGMGTKELIELTTFLRDDPYPVFSLLISRHGKLVYELYTAPFGRQEAHYLMSVTKSVLSALVGVTIDRKRISGPDAKVSEMLPRSVFASDADVERFSHLTLKQVMAMSGIDAPDPPRDKSEESWTRYRKFLSARNRVVVALEKPLLDGGFQYNDSTPTLAAAALQYGNRKSALELAEEALFSPMGFRNYEWMHQDGAGFDLGGYGLRLRPIDMQKFGILYLNHGLWNGRRLISKAWIAQSFEPWNKSKAELTRPDYGWFWWASYHGPGWTAHIANGWKGQRIIVIPDQGIVITMTACIEDGSDHDFVGALIAKVVKPAVEHGPSDGQGTIDRLIEEVKHAPTRVGDFFEHRMIPSVAPKGRRRQFNP
jgi:CubicO group peptidase (beta-lactamase class C family)